MAVASSSFVRSAQRRETGPQLARAMAHVPTAATKPAARLGPSALIRGTLELIGTLEDDAHHRFGESGVVLSLGGVHAELWSRTMERGSDARLVSFSHECEPTSSGCASVSASRRLPDVMRRRLFPHSQIHFRPRISWRNWGPTFVRPA